MIRIGQGYDCHCLVENRSLILGGVTIPFHKGLQGHSDGDALIHAIGDALLGAAALGDIGQHFPDTAVEFKEMDSRIFLRKIANLLQQNNFTINNIDATILVEQPKMLPHILSMRKNIAADLAIKIEQVSVKAKTNEKMDFVGRGEGIAVHAVALINYEDL